MPGKRELLVVADQGDVLCNPCMAMLDACRVRVLTASTTSEAINLARRDLLGIILSISGSGHARDRGLRVLAQKRPEISTILLVDTSSHGTAGSLASPGITDRFIEPVNPEDLAQALWRLLHCKGLIPDCPPLPPLSETDSCINGPEAGWREYSFLDESWFRLTDDGLAVVGVLLPLGERAGFRSLSLPQAGDMVYQGLPLAYAHPEAGPPRLIVAPLSGVVVAVNRDLETSAKPLLDDPCGRGWIAMICPTRSDTETKICRPRNVILINRDGKTAAQQRLRMCRLGCDVRIVRDWPEAAQAMWDRNNTIIVLDSASLAGEGPGIAGRLRSLAPEMRLVVVASAGACFEIEYRRQNVYFYAIEPFADGEIADILVAAFRPGGEAQVTETPAAIPEHCCGVRMAGRDGCEVRLLALGGLLQRGDGLGMWIHRKLQERLISHEMIGGQAKTGPAAIGAEAAKCNRLLVLAARDTGRLPGSLVRDARGEFVAVPPDAMGRTVGLVVQPGPQGGSEECLGRRATASLAEQVVNEMVLSWRVPCCGAAAIAGGRPGNGSRATP